MEALLGGTPHKPITNKEARITAQTPTYPVSNRYDRFPRETALAVDTMLAHLMLHRAIPREYNMVDDGPRGLSLRRVKGDIMVYRHTDSELTILVDKTWIAEFSLAAFNYGYNSGDVLAQYLGMPRSL